MNKFFSLHFWFDLRPGSLIPLCRNILIGEIIAFVVLTIVVFFLKKNKKSFYNKLYERLFNFFSTNVFVGLVLLFFSYETIHFLSARFWYGIWALSMITWLIFILKYFKSLPGKRKQIEENHKYNKYIP